MLLIALLCFTKSKNNMKTEKITPAIIRSAKIQNMTPEAYLSGLAAIKASLVRGRGIVE